VSEAEPRADRLQEALDRVRAGESVDVVLTSFADDGPLAADLLTILRMEEVLPISAPPEFRATLQADLQQQLLPKSGPTARRRLATALAGVMAALVLLVWSAVVVSADSLPGDALYPVKLARERTQLLLAGDPSARARVYLEMADNRLAEIAELARLGVPIPASLVEDLLEAEGDALEQAQESGEEGLVAAVEESASQAGLVVARIAKIVPTESRDLLERAGRSLGPAAPEAVPTEAGPAEATVEATASLSVIEAPTPSPTVVEPDVAPPIAPSPTALPTESKPTTAPEPTEAAGTNQPSSTREPESTAVSPSTPTPSATPPPSVEPTLPPTIAAIWTQRAREATEEARPTATSTPGRRRRHLAPTAEATPTEVIGDDPTAEPPFEPTLVPTASQVPSPTATPSL
jgi:hypothetical protein